MVTFKLIGEVTPQLPPCVLFQTKTNTGVETPAIHKLAKQLSHMKESKYPAEVQTQSSEGGK
jgi:hypothetical protein